MPRGGRVGTGARGAAVLVAVCTTLLVTSCRALETTVEVREDRTATVSLLVVPGVRNMDALGGEKGFGRLVRQFDDPDAGITARQVVEPGGMGMLVTVEAESLEELARPYRLGAPAPPGATVQLFDSFTVVRRGGTWRLDASARQVADLATGLEVVTGRLEADRYDINVRLPGRAGLHELKKLLQEAAVPPWIRPRLPLIYCGERLAAVAGMWIAAEFTGSGPCLRVDWEAPEALRAASPALPRNPETLADRVAEAPAAPAIPNSSASTADAMKA